MIPPQTSLAAGFAEGKWAGVCALQGRRDHDALAGVGLERLNAGILASSLGKSERNLADPIDSGSIGRRPIDRNPEEGARDDILAGLDPAIVVV